MRYLVFIVCFFSMFIPAAAQFERADTVFRVTEHEHFRPQKLILPGALMALGTWGLENGWLHQVNRKVNDRMADMANGHTTGLDDYLRFAPLVGSIILYKADVPVQYSLEERLAVRLTSFAAYYALAGGAKMLIREDRPDGSDNRGFPSGHTTVAFMGAEQIRAEYGGWYGVGAYTMACGVAFLRMYNQKHWFTDVVAGAGTGILCARLGYWLLPYERKLFHIKSKADGTAFVALPTYNASANAVGCAMAYQF